MVKETEASEQNFMTSTPNEKTITKNPSVTQDDSIHFDLDSDDNRDHVTNIFTVQPNQSFDDNSKTPTGSENLFEDEAKNSESSDTSGRNSGTATTEAQTEPATSLTGDTSDEKRRNGNLLKTKKFWSKITIQSFFLIKYNLRFVRWKRIHNCIASSIQYYCFDGSN